MIAFFEAEYVPSSQGIGANLNPNQLFFIIFTHALHMLYTYSFLSTHAPQKVALADRKKIPQDDDNDEGRQSDIEKSSE